MHRAANVGHYRLAGIEIDDPGVGPTITAAQIESVGRILAAYRDLCGWGSERIITHGDWTDAGAWLLDPAGNPSPPGPWKGRKTDTLRAFYPAAFWREQAAKHLGTTAPTAPVDRKAPTMLVVKYGSSRWRLVTGDRIVGISPAGAKNIIAAGIPWCALPSGDVESLESALVAENVE